MVAYAGQNAEVRRQKGVVGRSNIHMPDVRETDGGRESGDGGRRCERWIGVATDMEGVERWGRRDEVRGAKGE